MVYGAIHDTHCLQGYHYYTSVPSITYFMDINIIAFITAEPSNAFFALCTMYLYIIEREEECSKAEESSPGKTDDQCRHSITRIAKNGWKRIISQAWKRAQRCM